MGIITIARIAAQTIILAQTISLRGWCQAPVADMHYHVSMKAYNKNGVGIRKDLLDKKPIRSDYLTTVYDGQRGLDKRLKRKYGIIRPRRMNSDLSKYTQASLPQTFQGRVQLAFNAISPFEHNLAYSYWDRVFNKWFKSRADLRWLKIIGDWSEMTHFENFSNEYQFIVNQDKTLPDGTMWRFWAGTSHTLDPKVFYVVNVIEGGHALQHKSFDPGFQYSIRLSDERKIWKNLLIAEVQQKIDSIQASLKDSIAATRDVQRKTGLRDRMIHLTRNYKNEIQKIEQVMQPGRPASKRKTDSLEKKKNDAIEKELSANIRSIKRLDPPVFMMTISHLSYNGMVGHALALDGNGMSRGILKRFYRARVSHDEDIIRNWRNKFYAPPFPQERGKLVVESLLSRKNGHRIFVDLKHSGYPTRKWFCDRIALRSSDTIPPICSHCAANGLSQIHYSPTTDEYSYAESKYIKTLYPFSINLYDEEIKTICDLGGMIGITLEERVLGGYIQAKTRKKNIVREVKQRKSTPAIDSVVISIKKEKRDNRSFHLTDKEALDLLILDYRSVEPFLQNLFHIIDKSGNKERVWDRICLGSDLDGIIDPLDIIPTASQYPYFRKRLQQCIPIFFELDDAPGRDFTAYFRNVPDMEAKLDKLFYYSLRNFVIKNFLLTGDGARFTPLRSIRI